MLLSDYDVWGSCQQDNSGYHCEEGKKNETKSIQHHRSELPVAFSFWSVFIISDFLCDHTELL